MYFLIFALHKSFMIVVWALPSHRTPNNDLLSNALKRCFRFSRVPFEAQYRLIHFSLRCNILSVRLYGSCCHSFIVLRCPSRHFCQSEKNRLHISRVATLLMSQIGRQSNAFRTEIYDPLGAPVLKRIITNPDVYSLRG